MKIEQLKKSTRKTIRKIAKASGMSEEKVIAIMLRPSRSGKMTSHLEYGV